MQGAVQHRHQHKKRQHAGELRRPHLGAGQVLLVDIDHLHGPRRDAVHHQAQAGLFLAEALQQAGHAAGLSLRRCIGAGRHHRHRGHAALGQVSLEAGRHHQHRMGKAALEQCALIVGRGGLHRPGLAFDVVAQRGRLGQAHRIERAALGPGLQVRHQGRQRHQQQRAHRHRRQQHHGQRAPVPQGVAQLFAEHPPGGPHQGPGPPASAACGGRPVWASGKPGPTAARP